MCCNLHFFKIFFGHFFFLEDFVVLFVDRLIISAQCDFLSRFLIMARRHIRKSFNLSEIFVLIPMFYESASGTDSDKRKKRETGGKVPGEF